MGLQSLLTDTFRFFRNHFVFIVMIVVPVVFPIELFRVHYNASLAAAEPDFASQWPPLLLGLLAYPVHAAGIIFYIASVVSGERRGVRACWMLGLRFWWPFLLLSLLMGIATAFGFVLFFFPGLIVLGRFAFADFDLLLNKRSPADSLRYSWEATREYFWLVLGGYLVIFAAFYVPYFFLLFVLEDLAKDLGVFEIILDTFYAVLSTLITIYRFRVYDMANQKKSLGLRPEPDDQTSPD